MNAIFWILSEQQQAPLHAKDSDVTAHIHYACVLAADLYRQNKKIHIGVENQDQAHIVDDWLWQFEADRFIPHNLPGEGPHYGSPVEINWEPSQQRRGCFVNTCQTLPDYVSKLKGVNEWHDFVPNDEAGKAAARERYKLLKQAGFNLTTNQIPDSIV
ncbi:MAG: DNA polymerase-3 subunit chi [Psychrosphaera sp.]|jgi:DNA polymerase-3 subunit chi|uniref:DNA polymerase III subunit chi n=1 Tax=Psychrosphaera aquimarina TaxID=2044854 RepID=A0ABU3R0V7_9GAMM|nr:MULTISPECIES: DNA polymerase III subunit chi [Psychrosphaera]MBU2916738.1 DNA polymerase III subunit chi [Psychrosphaera sp. F3M07]MDU0113312.1 DNA polymerase III subunit chi [Psychrosphaera aquimarina]